MAPRSSDLYYKRHCEMLLFVATIVEDAYRQLVNEIHADLLDLNYSIEYVVLKLPSAAELFSDMLQSIDK